MPEDRTTTETEDRALIEAALFLSPQPLSRRGLAKVLGGVRLEYVDRLLAELEREYAGEAHGLELHTEEGRAGFRVKKAFIDRVSHLAPQQDIPRPVLRSLAVIAYNHPMTQADLVKVRGNKAYGHVQELLDRNLIRAEESGRTLLLNVTKEFLRHFGLSTVEEFRFHVAGLPEAEIGIEDGGETVPEPDAEQAADPSAESPREPEIEPEAEPEPPEGGG
jgi:segregation and condensation protein B